MILNKGDKLQEAQVQLNNRDHYRPLENPMVTETLRKVNELIAKLHNGNHIDDITKRWLSQTPNLPRIPIFYTLTKIHKPLPVGSPIILGYEGPTERISSFVDHLLQPIARKQKSYLKDMTDFINFIEKTEVSQNTILVSMDVTSLYTNIPHDEGITIVCEAYDKYHNNSSPILSHYLKYPALYSKKIRSSSTEKTLQIQGTATEMKISSQQKLKQKCLMKAESSRKYGNVT